MKHVIALLGLLFAASCLSAQTTPNLEVGYTLFGSFHGSDIDQVNLNNGKLEMRIPLLSYPQRGGKLHVGFSIHYSSPVYTETKNCYPIGAGGTNVCADIWDWSGPPAVDVEPDFGMFVGGGVIVDGGAQLVTSSITSFDGSVHQMGNLDNSFNQTNGYKPSLWEASDGSKIRFQEFADRTSVITDSDGTRYGGTGQSMEDANGNQVTWGSNGYVDTVGRQIPLAPRTDGSYPTFNGNATLCPNGPLPTKGAAAWNVPGYNTPAVTITFCYALVNISPPLPGPPPPPNFPDQRTPGGSYPLLQSIVLPQQPNEPAQAYTFQYDTASGFADLIKVTLPSGGSISYSWQDFRGCHYPPKDELDLETRSVATRTVSDGSSSNAWTYAVGDTRVGSTNETSNTVTVTDPAGNQEVHTFSDLAGCSFYETRKDSYQLIGGAQSLLKSVQTQYSFQTDPNAFQIPGSAINVLPTLVTTTWADGKTSSVEKQYDPGFTLYGAFATLTAHYGSLVSEKQHDYGQATAGAVIHQDRTTFQWQMDPSYLGFNLMDIPYQQQVLDGAGNLAAQTTYLYDGSSSPGTAPGAPASSGMGLAQELDLAPVNGYYRGNPTSITRYLNTGTSPTTLNTWYDTGELKTSIDPGNHPTNYTYDSTHGAFLTQTCLPTTNGVAHCTEGSYDTNTGLLTSFTDQNNQQTTYAYDTLLRLTSVSFPDLGGRSYTYTDGPNPKVDISEIMDSTNNITSSVQFDGLGRKVQSRLTSDPDGIDYTDTTYDALGRVASVSNPYRSTSDPTYGLTRYTYDALGRTTTVTQQDGNTATTNYTNFPTVIATSESGRQRQSTTDALGRLLQVVEPNPATGSLTAGSYATNYSYDALGNLTLVQQSGLANRTFTYDSLSRLTSAGNPESGITGYVYDADSEVIQRTRPQPNQTNSSVLLTTNYSYDFLHRKTGVSYTNDVTATPSQTFNYDETTGWGATPLAHTIGRMTTMYAGGIPGIAASMFSYDPNGRVAQDWQCTPRTCGASAFSFPYAYDKAGDVISESNGVTATFTNTYNAAGRLVSMSSNYTPDGNHPGALLSGAHYGPLGLDRDTLGNGLSETYSYQQRGWLQNAAFGGTTAAYATGAVQYSGSEQLHNATYGTGSVSVGFSEPGPVQVQTAPATQATGWVSISGTEGGAKRVPCASGSVPLTPIDAGELQSAPVQNVIAPCYLYEYDSGEIEVYVNGAQVGWGSWDQGSDPTTVASDLAYNINSNGSSPVTAAASGSVVYLTTKAYGAGTNYTLGAHAADGDPANFSPHFGASISGPNLTGGANATYAWVYDTGQATLCINGNCGYRYNWNQNDSASTVAAGLAAAVQADGGRLANASANGAAISFAAIAIGGGGNYGLSASSSYDSAHFAGPAASFSASGMGGGSDGVPDTGSATLTVAGLTKTHTWSSGDTATNIAGDLANQLNADGTRQANATTSSCGTNCTQINLTATTQGPDPSYSGGISHSNPSGYFPNSSFNATPTGTTAMTGGAVTTPSLYSYALSFAPDGDIVSANDSVNGNWTYTYDQLNRLATSNKNSGQQAFSYTYDQFGNRWNQTATAGAGPQPSYSFTGGNNRIDGAPVNCTAATPYCYDAAGNLLNDGTHQYVYDAENRIACVDPVTAGSCANAAATYVYDAEGKRVRTHSYEYLYDLEGRSIALLDAGTGAWDYGEIYAGARHLATYSGGTTVFDHSDWLGTERMRTSPTGAVAESCSSLPFGDGLSCTGTDYSFRHFTGKEHDNESNLEYFVARYHSSTMGRFMSPDWADKPIDVPYSDFGDPQSLNLYSYVRNNPMSHADADGHDGNDSVKFLGGVVKGVASSLTYGYVGAPSSNDSAASLSGQIVGTGMVGSTGTSILSSSGPTAIGGLVAAPETGGASLVVTAGAGVEAVVGSGMAAGAAKNAGALVVAMGNGSYTNTHASGKTYVGKGDAGRASDSAKRVEGEHNDKHVATNHTNSPNDRESFKDESKRLDQQGGAGSTNNYNKIESPGKKYRQQDGSN